MNTPRLLPITEDNKDEIYFMLEQWIKSLPLGSILKFGIRSRWCKRDDIKLISTTVPNKPAVAVSIRKKIRHMNWVHLYIHLESVTIGSELMNLPLLDIGKFNVLAEHWLLAKTDTPIVEEKLITNLEKLCWLWNQVGTIIPVYKLDGSYTKYEMELTNLLFTANKVITYDMRSSKNAENMINNKLLEYDLTLDYLINRYHAANR